ncbi:hypothetical protein [Rhodococcoides fascians]|uniref:hypothetical protein n=1 Tax=Rhodococcoides fascians TaxID=1828 RepID=UPI00050BE0FE|nr:hypothetical protein [Rhodococcus fascians]
MTTSEVQAVHEKEFAANYRGNTTDVIGQRVGPNRMGEHFKAVSAEYDPSTDRTRVIFDLIPAPAHAGQAKYYDSHLNETRKG